MSKNYKKKRAIVIYHKPVTGRHFFDAEDEEHEQRIVSKLEEGFMCDFTDKQACHWADISVKALYRYQKKYPEFRDRKHILKQRVQMKAKILVNDRLNKGGSGFLALELLKCRAPEEYNKKPKDPEDEDRKPIKVVITGIDMDAVRKQVNG